MAFIKDNDPQCLYKIYLLFSLSGDRNVLIIIPNQSLSQNEASY